MSHRNLGILCSNFVNTQFQFIIVLFLSSNYCPLNRQKLSISLSQEGDESASKLLEYLMHNCHHDNRSVFRNNLEIIKTMMELWRDRLQVPTKYVYDTRA